MQEKALPAEIIIPVPGSRARFRGWLIDEVSSRIDDSQLRYTVIRLYRVDDPAKPGVKYLLSVIGKSVVYHRSGCGPGVPVKISDLEREDVYDDLVECPRCKPRPIEDMEDDDTVDLEMDRVNPVRECPDAASVRTRLEQPMRGPDGEVVRDDYGRPVMFLSAPAERLLRRAAQADEDIAALALEIEDL